MSTYISSNAVDNPGVIYGCLHIYPVMLWTILASSMVVYIYIQYCCGQSWGYLWLSTYISSNAVDNPGVIYGCLHIYPVMLWTILGSYMVVCIYIQNAVDNSEVSYVCPKFKILTFCDDAKDYGYRVRLNIHYQCRNSSFS